MSAFRDGFLDGTARGWLLGIASGIVCALLGLTAGTLLSLIVGGNPYIVGSLIAGVMQLSYVAWVATR